MPPSPAPLAAPEANARPAGRLGARARPISRRRNRLGDFFALALRRDVHGFEIEAAA
jgi:hypothetical protein